MKKLLLPGIIIMILLFGFARSSFAQGLFVPTFDSDKTSSLHFGFGEMYTTLEDKSTHISADFSQDIVFCGINWEQNVNFGFYHVRIGYVVMGETEITLGSLHSTDTAWKDYQEWSGYLGFGYVYIAEFKTAPTPRALKPFFGGGIDFNIFAAEQAHSSGGTDYDTLLYAGEAALYLTGGLQIPQINFVFYTNIGLHFLLTWESRETQTTGGSETVTYASDTTDMSIPVFGIEIGASYQLPTVPRFRFGIAAQFISNLYVIFHAGYSFK